MADRVVIRCFSSLFKSIANKFVSIAGAHLSKTLQKKIAKFSQYDDSLGRFMVSMPLIAQLGRNFNPNLISRALKHLEEDALIELSGKVLEKLNGMSDEEFARIELMPFCFPLSALSPLRRYSAHCQSYCNSVLVG